MPQIQTGVIYSLDNTQVQIQITQWYTFSIMNEEASKQIVRRYYDEAWNRNRIEVIDELFAADYKAGNLPSWRKPGAAGLRAFIADNHRIFPDIIFTITWMVAEDDTVAIHFKAPGTQKGEMSTAVGLIPATGKRAEWDGSSFFRFENGKIVETQGVINNLKMIQQLGALPSA